MINRRMEARSRVMLATVEVRRKEGSRRKWSLVEGAWRKRSLDTWFISASLLTRIRAAIAWEKDWHIHQHCIINNTILVVILYVPAGQLWQEVRQSRLGGCRLTQDFGRSIQALLWPKWCNPPVGKQSIGGPWFSSQHSTISPRSIQWRSFSSHRSNWIHCKSPRRIGLLQAQESPCPAA